MYVRKTKTRNSTCFQIGNKINGKFILLKHIGCTSVVGQIDLLQKKAKNECEQFKIELQPPLFSPPISNLKARLSNWRITGFHQVFGHIYDLIGFPSNMFRDLVIARIVYPKSKLATSRYFDQYLGVTFSEDKIYRFMDTLNKDELTRIAFNFVSKKNNGIALIFYDVTTLYFESDNEDDLRKKGYSKDHKNDLPQIVIGLFVDKDGYPFGFDFYDGSTFEGHTFPKAIKALTIKYKFKDLVVVADAGMLSEKNISFLETEKLNYIVGARLKGLSEKFKEQIFDHNFTKEPTFEIACKTKLGTREARDKRLIIDFSEKRAKKDKFTREKLIKKLEVKIASKKELIKKSKYLIFKNQGKAVGIDQNKIELDKRHDGLKGYWTNLKEEIKPKEIIDQYHSLWQVEKAFRMSKNDLQERPVFHRKIKRIGGHLLICFCSLLIMKETERILKPAGISLKKAIEVLGKLGQGEMKLGKIKMPIESELNPEAKSILDKILGH